MKKDLYSQCTDTLRDISSIPEIPEELKEALEKEVKSRDEYYEQNKEFIPKSPPSR